MACKFNIEDNYPTGSDKVDASLTGLDGKNFSDLVSETISSRRPTLPVKAFLVPPVIGQARP